MAFDGGHIDGWCTGSSIIIVVVVCDGEADSVHFRFEWLECCHDSDITNGASFGDVVERNGFDGFGTVGSEAAEFVAPTFFPQYLIWTFD